MSDQENHTTSDPGQPEYLGASESRPHSGHRWAAVVAASVAVLAAAGAGAWGVAQLMAGGDSPASAVPGDAVAYLSLDLDPAASQKVQALTTLKKFPAIAEHLDLGVRDDLRRWVFEQAQEDGACKNVDYAVDIAPWLGDRMAVAAVPDGSGSVTPLVVLQVSDQDAARAGAEVMSGCADEDVAIAFVGDYMLLSEKQRDVDDMAAAAGSDPLVDDAGFATWMDRVGDPGIVTAYAAAGLPQVLIESELAEGAEDPDLTEQVGSLYEDFEGAAAVVRFAEGSVEAEVASAGLPAGMASGEGVPTLGTLPDTTAAALSVGLPNGWLQDYTASMQEMMGTGENESADDFWTEMERGSGFQLPEDIETLLGDGLTLAADSSADLDSIIEGDESTDVPVGVRISGDPSEITRVLDKVLVEAGEARDLVFVRETDDGVTIGLQKEYVDELVAGGSLAETESFSRVIPDVDRVGAAFYVDFDAGDDWARRLADDLSSGDPEVVENVAPLDAVGLSSWTEEDISHGLFRMTTD